MPLTSLQCCHFSTCSGCLVEHDLHAPPIALEAEKFFLQCGLENFSTIFEESKQWRCRAKLAVRGCAKNPLIGLFQEGSHFVVPISNCVVHEPLINKAIYKVQKKMQQMQLGPYNEKTLKGLVRYLQFFVCRRDHTVQLSVVANIPSENDPQFLVLTAFLHALWKEDKEKFWHSLWMNFNVQSNNVIFGAHWKKIEGEEYLIENLLGGTFYFQPMVFSQANLSLFEQILGDIAQHVNPGLHIIEYYAGIGIIGLTLAQQAASVICCESHPAAENLFHKSYAAQKDRIKCPVHFVASDVSKQLHLLRQGSVLIVDPPRKGLDIDLLNALQTHNHTIEQIVYLSCGFASFQRDALGLIKAGWQIYEAKGYILFPGTNHIETLGFFKRIRKAK